MERKNKYDERIWEGAFGLSAKPKQAKKKSDDCRLLYGRVSWGSKKRYCFYLIAIKPRWHFHKGRVRLLLIFLSASEEQIAVFAEVEDADYFHDNHAEDGPGCRRIPHANDKELV